MHDEVDPLDPGATRWPRIDVMLRTLATRLTHAAEGRTTVLDSALTDLRQRLREPLGEESLQALMHALTSAMRSLEADRQPPAAADAQTRAETLAGAGTPLLALIDKLQLDEAAGAALQRLRTEIGTSKDLAALAEQAEALAEMLNRDHQQRAAQLAAVQQLLTQVTTQLGELAQYLEHADADQTDGASARQTLDHNLTSEMDALGTRLQSAPDLSSLQTEIQLRMNAISTHLKGFHEQEDARARVWQTRSEQMDRRIHELERSAQDMEVSLREEHQRATTDPLTGIANRLVFEQRLAQVCKQATQPGAKACLLMLDIDHFKQINDQFGHAAGDRALRIVVRQLHAMLRPTDLLARYGGEEFAVILSGASMEAGTQKGESLRRQIESTSFRGKQKPVQITLCCGVTSVRDGDTPATVFARADRALYLAKDHGRNRVEAQ
ncbi:MAG: GGDEF domain-containing protein [Rhodanobacter sp.]